MTDQQRPERRRSKVKAVKYCPHCPQRLESALELDLHLRFECEGLGR